MLYEAMTACRRLSDPEYIRCMMAKSAFQFHATQLLKAVTVAVTPSEMTEAQAIAADLCNNERKAEKAHAAQVRNASRLPACYQVGA